MTTLRLYAALSLALALVVIGLLVFGLVRSQRTWEIDLYSGQEGGLYLPVAESIAALIEEEEPSIRVRVLQSEGSIRNLRQLATANEALTMAIVQNDTPSGGSTGSIVRSLVPLHMGALHFVASQESEIRALSDLDGRRVAIGMEGSGSMQLALGLLAHYGVVASEVVPCELDQACQKLVAGEVEAILMTSGLKSQTFEAVCEKLPLRLIGLGDGIGPGSEMAGFQLSWPFISQIQIPKFAYQPPGKDSLGVPPEAVPTIGARAVLLTHENFPEPIARKITRLLNRKKAVLIRQNPEASRMLEDIPGEILQYPMHQGAMAYLQRNEPGFWHQNAEVFGFLLSTVATLVGLLLATRRWMLQRQKDRIDVFYRRLGEIWRTIESRQKEVAPLADLREELQGIRDTAINLLAEEKLPADESFRIFQDLWEQCMDRIERKSA